jgi:two-component system NarL family sensor kinase
MRHLFLFLIVNSVFFLYPVFSQESIDIASLLPDQSPVVTLPQATTGTIDSLEKAKILLEKSNFQEALKISLNVLNQAKIDNNLSLIYDCNDLIASIFKKSNNYEKALGYYLQNLKLLKTSHNLIKKANVSQRISGMYFEMRELEKSEYYLNSIIKMNDNSLDFKPNLAAAYSGLSGIYVEKNNLELAEIYAQKALEIQKSQKEVAAIVNTLNNLGSIYILKKDYLKAKKVFLEALSLLENNDDQKYLGIKEVLYFNLSEALYRLKDYKAFTYQELSFNIRDSLRDNEISRILGEIEGKYNTENIKKEAQLKTAEEVAKRKHTQDINIILILISLLLTAGIWMSYRYFKLRQEKLKLELMQSQLIQQSELEKIQNDAREKILNATLDGKESERKMIAETLHHSVSSLLSSASLHLQASKMIMKNSQPEEIEKAHTIIKEAAEKIRNLSHALVSSVLLKFGLKYALQDMCDKYSNSALEFQCDCDGVGRFEPDFELKINSIIDEFLNNIIKHSQATQAQISLKENKSNLEINIYDNGKGFNPKTPKKDSGLGLRQIEARINKMEGVFNINSSPEKGTHIYISVPIQMKEELVSS